MNEVRSLIVDDEIGILDLLQMIIESEWQGPVFLAKNGEEAIKICQEQNYNFDFILSDYNMPHKNGGEFFLWLKEKKSIPFLLMSARKIDTNPEFIDFKKTNKFNNFFEKPIETEELITYIHNILKDKST